MITINIYSITHFFYFFSRIIFHSLASWVFFKRLATNECRHPCFWMNNFFYHKSLFKKNKLCNASPQILIRHLKIEPYICIFWFHVMLYTIYIIHVCFMRSLKCLDCGSSRVVSSPCNCRISSSQKDFYFSNFHCILITFSN